MSMLFEPWDHILATKAKVRLLRALSTGAAAGSVRSLARDAGVSHTPALQALNELADAGIVVRRITGRQHGFALHPENVLVQAVLQPMFEAEAKRLDQIFSLIKEAAEQFKEKIAGAYIFGSAARGEDVPGSDFDILIITRTAAAIDVVSDALADRLDSLRTSYGLSPSVVTLSRARLREMRETDHAFLRGIRADVRVVFGPELGDL